MKTLKMFVASTVLIIGSSALANDVIDMQGQKVVLLQPATVQSIEAELAKTDSTPAEKASAIKSVLALEVTAPDGFCATAVTTYGNELDRPKPADVAKACPGVLADTDFIDGIVSGEVVQNAPAGQDLRLTLSQFVSGYLVMLAMGGF